MLCPSAHSALCAVRRSEGITFVYMSSSKVNATLVRSPFFYPLRFRDHTDLLGRCLIKYADVELRSASPGTGGLPAEVDLHRTVWSCNNSEFDVVIVEDEIVLLDRTAV